MVVANREDSMRRSRLPILFITLLFVTAPILVSGARAEGAIAIGTSGNIADDGVAIGTAVNYATSEAAVTAALKRCRSYADAPKMAKICKVAMSFTRQCYALNMDPDAGTPGFGWAVAATKQEAVKQAQAACEATAGADRQSFCKPLESGCDTKS
jgi:hypothetical protein